jgi:hypothetical protein
MRHANHGNSRIIDLSDGHIRKSKALQCLLVFLWFESARTLGVPTDGVPTDGVPTAEIVSPERLPRIADLPFLGNSFGLATVFPVRLLSFGERVL